MVRDSKLRQVFAKDPRHREPRKIGFGQTRENISSNYIENRISA